MMFSKPNTYVEFGEPLNITMQGVLQIRVVALLLK